MINKPNTPCVFAELEKGYTLYEFTTLEQLVEEYTAFMSLASVIFNFRSFLQNTVNEHRKPFDFIKYWNHINSNNLRVFFVKNPNGKMVYAIAYNPKNGHIVELDECGFSPKIKKIGKSFSYNENGRHIRFLYEALDVIDKELGIVLLNKCVRVDDTLALTRRGYVDPIQVELDDIIAGVAFIKDSDSLESIQRICTKFDIELDINLLNETNLLPKAIFCRTTISSRSGTLSLPSVHRVEDLFYECDYLDAPNLRFFSSLGGPVECVLNIPEETIEEPSPTNKPQIVIHRNCSIHPNFYKLA